MSEFACQRCAHRPEPGIEVEPVNEFSRANLCPDCGSTCKECGPDVGYKVMTNEQGYEFLVPCSCQEIKEKIQRYNRSRIPARYSHCVLNNYDPRGGNQRSIKQQIYTHLNEYYPKRKGLVVSGKVGTGKTHLIVSILRHLSIKYGVNTAFIEFTHLLSDIKESYSTGRFESDVLAPLTQVPVLLVDELGKGRASDWQLSVLDEVISRRYNAQLTTYFTTNLPLSIDLSANGTKGGEMKKKSLRKSLEAISLQERVGERIFSRLHEMCHFLEIEGPDSRRNPRGNGI